MKTIQSLLVLILLFSSTATFSHPVTAFAPLVFKDGLLLVIILGIVAVYKIARVLLSSE